MLFRSAFLILFALTFSFGYERGKWTAEQRIQELTSHIETIPAVPTAPEFALNQNQDVADNRLEMPALTVDNPKTTLGNDKAGKKAEVAPAVISTPVQEKAPAIQKESTQAVAIRKYTIQVATAISKDLAEKEVKRLGKNGRDSFFVQYGRHYAICVGTFETVKSAKPLLGELKGSSLYADAFVRFFPSTP